LSDQAKKMGRSPIRSRGAYKKTNQVHHVRASWHMSRQLAHEVAPCMGECMQGAMPPTVTDPPLGDDLELPY